MQRYDSYKDSGIQWLGEIPSHWEVKRIASLGFFSKGGGFSRNDLVEEDGLPAILYGDIYTKYNIEASKIISKVKYEVEKYSVLAHKGDLLMTGSGETKEDIGKTIVLKTDSYIGGDVIRFSQKGHDSKFLSYFLNSQYAKSYRFREAKGEIIVHIYASALKNMYISLPPFPEQQAIASYLDTTTAKIDEAIAQQQKMIDLLNERKQIIINNAVTKGLNPNAKMKPSGIDWIGNIPEHWGIIPIKHISKFVNGYAFDSNIFKTNGEIPVIRISNIADGRVCLEDIAYVSYRKELDPYITAKDDLLIAMSGATTGKVGFDHHGGSYINQRVGIIRSDYQRFLFYWLNSTFFKEYVNLSALGSAQPNISSKGISNFQICFPLKEEIGEIVNFIDHELDKIGVVVSNCTKQIALLQERKQIIINDVVTGKVKVI